MIEDVLKRCSACRKCDTIEEYKQFPKDTHGNMLSKAMIIGEAPGKSSLQNGQFCYHLYIKLNQ